MNLTPRLVLNMKCQTGEGPLWHPDEQCLYWLDIPRSLIYRYSPTTKEAETFRVNAPVGGMTLQEDGDLALFMARGVVRTWRNGEFVRTILDGIERERDSRFNDVIADPQGRVFCGVMSTDRQAGCLYRFDPGGELAVVLEGTGTANGMGFSPDQKSMYFCDSRQRTLSRFDYDGASGAISNRTILAEPEGDEGKPDGMTVDSEGCLWSARWNGFRIVRHASDGAEMLTIPFPVRNVSCLTFGGPTYTDIYVTTAGAQDTAENGELAGGLFHLNVGIRGCPEFRSRL